MVNLLCAEREDSEVVVEGESCVEAFLNWVCELTETDEEDVTRPVIDVAHDF